MIIENPDVFKSWLTSILEPLCDADPAALAKYVYALVKKEKPLDELRDGMLDQLDVFLQQETKPFVDMLFKALETHEYLKGVDKLPTPPPQDSPGAEPSPVDAQDTPVPAPPVGNDEGLQRAAVRHRVVLSRQGGKRQPPHEQTLVKVLPLTELLEEPVDQPPRRRDRREILREKDDRRRRRSRSWERRVRARRHARDDASEIRRRPGSRSPSPRGRYRNRSPPSDRPASRSKSRSPVRDRDHERERDRLRIPREMERDRMSRDREHRERISRSRDRDRSRDRSLSPHEPRLDRDRADAYKRRCRDFDEKGYCMRGDQCQWDHGADPVVLEDAALTRALVVPPVPEYNPLAPDIWCGARFPYAPPRHVAPPRELVPIPRIRHEVPPMMGTMLPPPAPMQPRHPPPMKKNFEYNRIGPIRHPLPPNAAICSLEVKKVPRGLNDITHLNNHFSKFGKIVNIQVCFEGDQEAALITFSNPTEANVAYKSTEAVLNNRFIKVFWHNPENKQENMPPSNQQVKKPEREASQHPMSQNKVLINKDAVKATADSKKLMADKAKELTNGQEAKKDPPPASAPAPAPAAADKSTRLVSMHKRAQELLETQLSQQRLLIEKLESGNVTGPQKTALLEAVNSAQEGIEKLRKELVALRQMQDETVARSLSRLQLDQTNAKKPKTKEEAHKEILDAELDLFTKQQEGQDVTELAKKLAEMKRQMAVQFPTHPAMRRPHSRGGRFNSATRFTRLPAAVVPKAFSVNQTVDHRPRALLISGFEADELEPLVVHFSQFGEVTGKEVNLSVPELVLQYRLRAQAEVAAVKGRHYNDRTLSITWANPKQVAGLGSTPAPTTNDAVSEDNKHETPTEVTADALLRFDEEEDDDNEEDRSWRR